MLRRGFAALMVGAFLAVSVLGPGIARAATQPPVGFSDQVRFTGSAVPGPVPGSYTFTSATCSLVSDPFVPGVPNEGPFACRKTAQITPAPYPATVAGSVTITPTPVGGVLLVAGTVTVFESVGAP